MKLFITTIAATAITATSAFAIYTPEDRAQDELLRQMKAPSASSEAAMDHKMTTSSKGKLSPTVFKTKSFEDNNEGRR